MYDKITVMCDLDDCLWELVENWIAEYQKQRAYQFKWGILDDEHDASLDKSMVTSWNIEECLNPTDKELFWEVLDNPSFWSRITISEATKSKLKALNSHENIDLIICTDTHYKSSTAKLNRFFELCPFIEPRQVICMKEKWRLNPDVINQRHLKNLCSKKILVVQLLLLKSTNRGTQLQSAIMNLIA